MEQQRLWAAAGAGQLEPGSGGQAVLLLLRSISASLRTVLISATWGADALASASRRGRTGLAVAATELAQGLHEAAPHSGPRP